MQNPQRIPRIILKGKKVVMGKWHNTLTDGCLGPLRSQTQFSVCLKSLVCFASFLYFFRMELRCVIAIIRHGDRTPKQKMKMEVRHPLWVAQTKPWVVFLLPCSYNLMLSFVFLKVQKFIIKFCICGKINKTRENICVLDIFPIP